MNDPYAVLGLPPEADDEAIRQRYLELVRRFTPEGNPDRFAAVRAAYEQLRDLDSRVRYRLFEQGKYDDIDGILKELECQTPRLRFSLATLLALRNPPR
jgi:curved DNA-binding protein CbpA